MLSITAPVVGDAKEKIPFEVVLGVSIDSIETTPLSPNIHLAAKSSMVALGGFTRM